MPITAKAFQSAFVDAFTSNCNLISPEDREVVWQRWNDLMLPLEMEGSLCPKPWIEESVLAKTAKRLGLRYHTREMLRLDAIYSLDAEWFPIVVAIEHENDYRGFISEIIKLLSIRSPLKVGITYLYSREGQEQTVIANIKNLIGENFCKIAKIAPENERIEYLFLVGAETSSAPKQISRWYSLDFHACEDWQNKRFELVALVASS